MKTTKSLFISLSLVLAMGWSGLANALVIDVMAKENSTRGTGVGAATGLIFSAGDLFTASVAADDLWNAGALPRWSNADGLTGDLIATGTDDSGQAAGVQIGRDFGVYNFAGLSLPFGTLVGSIDGNFFAMGTDFAGPAIASGELLLWYWDSNNGDNTGQIAVTIDSAAVPEPGTLPLLGLSLLVLGLLKRKSL